MGLIMRKGFEARAFACSDEKLEEVRVTLSSAVKSRDISEGEREKCRLALGAVVDEQRDRADWKEHMEVWALSGDDEAGDDEEANSEVDLDQEEDRPWWKRW